MTAPRAIALFADIRFPSPRANGIQVVKTAHALARCGAEVDLVVRRSDPRGTGEILRLFGLDEHERLRVRRLSVAHAPGRNAAPRALFVARALAMGLFGASERRVLFTRDLQLADLLIRLGAPRVAYEAHAVEAVMFDERAQLYGSTGDRKPPDAAKRARIAAREKRVWLDAAVFVATTRGILDWFCREHGPRPRTGAIPNGCDVEEGSAFAEPPDGATVVYAGQMYPWKGVDLLLRAFANVTTKGARLVAIGGVPGEPDFERVKALAASLGLDGRVEFRGPVPQAEVARALALANVVAAPFLESAMTAEHTSPIKAFEAMAAGRALVISDTKAAREIVQEGVTGVFAKPGDAAAWTAALERVLSDRSLQTRLARAAFDRAPEYAWRRRAERLLALFSEAA